MIQYDVDLHLHSTFSDGLKTPEELCLAADERRLRRIALCDHDTVEGLDTIACAAASIRERRLARGDARPFEVLNCIELSSGPDGRTHLLGYGVDKRNSALLSRLSAAQTERARRAGKMLLLLERAGVSIPSDEQERLLAVPRVGRAHFARCLIKIGVVSTMQQAFDRYLSEGRCAYVPREWLETPKALQLLKGAGACVSLAHPMRLGLSDTARYALLEALRENGLDALEIYHPSASRRDIPALALLAKRLNLLVTGGSDYHGEAGDQIGRMPSGWADCGQDVAALVRRVSGSR